MDDLISRSKLINRLKRRIKTPRSTMEIIRDIIPLVEIQPPVEAVPVVRGEWMDNPYAWECNLCGTYVMIADGDADMNFCPNCGADMRKKVQE